MPVSRLDEPRRKGFSYGTLPGHPEAGEERLLVERRDDAQIQFTGTSYSRPATTLGMLARPRGRVAQLAMTRRYLRGMDRPA